MLKTTSDALMNQVNLSGTIYYYFFGFSITVGEMEIGEGKH